MNIHSREAVVEKLASAEFDVLVIGGGVTGVGAALDAATRGLRVALIEANDFACGTSSRSSKLIHGGLRYLEQFDFKLDTAFNQLFHKTYHCNDTGLLPNWIHGWI